MKTVKYRNIYGIGESSDPWENAHLDEFLKIAPDLFYIIFVGKVLPPIAILNDLFSKNESNAGMSGHIIWKPFQIDENEYQDLVEILCTDPELNIVQDQTNNDMTSFKLWRKKASSSYSFRR